MDELNNQTRSTAMPYDKKTGKKVPYTKANVEKAKSSKGGLSMKKPANKKTMKRSSKKY